MEFDLFFLKRLRFIDKSLQLETEVPQLEIDQFKGKVQHDLNKTVINNSVLNKTVLPQQLTKINTKLKTTIKLNSTSTNNFLDKMAKQSSPKESKSKFHKSSKNHNISHTVNSSPSRDHILLNAKDTLQSLPSNYEDNALNQLSKEQLLKLDQQKHLGYHYERD